MATFARPPPVIDAWPPLPLEEWRETKDTLQRFLQLAGKLRIALTPETNHWWNAGLQLTAHGLTTLALPWRGGAFELNFDFVDHEVVLQTSWDDRRILELAPRTVAAFHRDVMAMLRATGIEPELWDVPMEVADRTPFSADRHHAAYDHEAVSRWFQVMLSAKDALERFRARFTGKASPVQFYWGGFDLSVALYSGRPAPEREGDAVYREGVADESFSAGFWPGDERFADAAFFAYLSPEPEELPGVSIRPAAARHVAGLGEFLLPWEAVRTAEDPLGEVLAFFTSTYEAGAALARWDRVRLERPLIVPHRHAEAVLPVEESVPPTS